MRRELLLLREMTDAADRVRELIAGADIGQLRADSMRREAVLWNYTILGEAASQVPAEIKEAYPAIEWAQAIRLRNRIVHGYWDVDLHVLHGTTIEDLPTLSKQRVRALDELSRD